MTELTDWGKTVFLIFFVKMSPINFLKNEKSYIFADQKFR